MKSVLPHPSPSKFQQDPSQVPSYARELAETITVQTLVKHALMVFGVWQNVCTLGVLMITFPQHLVYHFDVSDFAKPRVQVVST
jgi:hypothetical protein